jgi:hypothetical protein
MREKWLDFYTRGDPFYNPNLTLAREDYSLNFYGEDPFTIPSGV